MIGKIKHLMALGDESGDLRGTHSEPEKGTTDKSQMSSRSQRPSRNVRKPETANAPKSDTGNASAKQDPEPQLKVDQPLAKFSQYQRVGVFVDVQNMFYSAKHLRNAKLNFGKLMEKAVRGRQLIRAICYVVDNPDIDQTGFTDMLKSNGYEIKSKELRLRADGSSKADWDMGMAIDAVSLADKLDIVVLVTGDGDFIDLVKFLQHRGVYCEAISFPRSTNDDLIKAVDLHIPIEKELLIMPRRNFFKR